MKQTLAAISMRRVMGEVRVLGVDRGVNSVVANDDETSGGCEPFPTPVGEVDRSEMRFLLRMKAPVVEAAPANPSADVRI